MIYTIGHSNHPMERFLELLRLHEIEVVADVRSAPYSRFCPRFNRDALKKSFQDAGIQYVFLGKELGGKREEMEACTDGRVDFLKVATLPLFRSGIDRLLRGAEQYRISIMCAEKNPFACHRSILVSRALKEHVEIRHILTDGTLLSHEEWEREIMERFGGNATLLGESGTERLADAYRRLGEKLVGSSKRAFQSKERP